MNDGCIAARAAAGQGEDAHMLPDKVATMFRRWALGWLRDHLMTAAQLVEQNNPGAKSIIWQGLVRSRSHPDLASVRDPQALDRLPDHESAPWRALWRDVDQLATRMARQP